MFANKFFFAKLVETFIYQIKGMDMKHLFSLLLFFASSLVYAETNTPYPAGTSVSVTTSSGTVKGKLQDINVPQWISILEENASDPTLVRGSDVILRRFSSNERSFNFGISSTSSSRSSEGIPLKAKSFRSERRERRTDDVEGHYIYGRPRPVDDRFKFKPPGHTEDVDGITILVREAFTLGHNDKRKGPAWVAMRWTKDDFDAGDGVSMDRGDFVEDEDLPVYARGGTNFNFATTQMERGHMCPDNDLESWGFPAVREGMRMSNIIPQRKSRNHAVWGRLEKQTHNIVNDSDYDITSLWILSGPVYSSDESTIRYLGNQKAIPKATYKVVAWKDGQEDIHARAYIIAQQDTDVNLTNYLVSIDTVEERTGLDFFHQLDDSVEGPLEAAEPSTLWE
jgi:endonuclease G, mitochondrial